MWGGGCVGGGGRAGVLSPPHRCMGCGRFFRCAFVGDVASTAGITSSGENSARPSGRRAKVFNPDRLRWAPVCALGLVADYVPEICGPNYRVQKRLSKAFSRRHMYVAAFSISLAVFGLALDPCSHRKYRLISYTRVTKNNAKAELIDSCANERPAG